MIYIWRLFWVLQKPWNCIWWHNKNKQSRAKFQGRSFKQNSVSNLRGDNSHTTILFPLYYLNMIRHFVNIESCAKEISMMTYSFWRFRKKRKRITGIGLDNYVSSIIKHQYILLKWCDLIPERHQANLQLWRRYQAKSEERMRLQLK